VLAKFFEQAAHRLLLGVCDFKHAFDVLTYSLDCQIKPSVVASRLYALLAQQTVHLLCPECKQVDTSDFARQVVDQLPAASVERHQGSVDIFRPEGCPACYMTGYAQSTVLFEVLMMETWLKDMLKSNQSLADIRKEAEQHAFVSLEQKCSELLLSGETSIEQVLSIVMQGV
jgi:type II secretory ATPase GspE/PulE/Tfp pilus assembly ATPase PilB-like protein